MKNIFKLLFVFIAAGALLVSCDKETNFAALTGDVDANATYYLQFVDASQSAETGVTLEGGLVEIETTIAVALMGTPQSADITVDFAFDATNTIDPSMYVMSASSVTIPAGKTSGSVTFVTIAANMPVGETLELVLNMDAGAHNNPNPAGTQIKYSLKRIAFCPLENGAADLVGTWKGVDAWYGTGFTSALNADGVRLDVSGMAAALMANWWGEPVVSGGTYTMDIAGNGFVTIPRQYIFTCDWKGTLYDYEVEGTGKWTNCGDTPTLYIEYDIYYPGDEDGILKSYGGVPFGTAVVTLNGKKSTEVLSNFPKKVTR